VRERGREEHCAEQQAGDGRVARQRDALDGRQQQRGGGRDDQRERHPAVATRCERRLVAGLERGGRGHRGCLARGAQRRDDRGDHAEREECQRLHGLNRELGCDATEVARAEVGAERCEAGARDGDAERDA
jgi:hypothetical protein